MVSKNDKIRQNLKFFNDFFRDFFGWLLAVLLQAYVTGLFWHFLMGRKSSWLGLISIFRQKLYFYIEILLLMKSKVDKTEKFWRVDR